MLKKILFILGLLIFADIIIFSWLNHGGIFEFHYEPFLAKTQWDMGLATISLCAYTVIGTLLVMTPYISNLKEQVQKKSRSNEKASIISEESQDKVKLLEAKIKTLEKALDAALNKE